jgi:hypothetical protein
MPVPNTENVAICQGFIGSIDSRINKIKARTAKIAPMAWEIALNGSLIFTIISYLLIIVAIP